MDKKSNSLSIASIFSDGMVLQRGVAHRLWGQATPLEVLEVEFRGVTYTSQADNSGDWELLLQPQDAGGPFELKIRDSGSQIVLNDILIGDVWLLGGQSNMELPIQRTLDLYEQEVKGANNPWIRQFQVPMTYSFEGPQKDLPWGRWRAVTPETIYEFSALGYFFAQAHFEKYQVPVGLVLTAVGGTPIEAWLNSEVIQNIGGYEEVVAQCQNPEFIEETTKLELKRLEDWYGELHKKDSGLQITKTSWHSEEVDDSNWESFLVPKSWQNSPLEGVHGVVWFRKKIVLTKEMLQHEALLRLGAIIDADETYINGTLVGKTDYKYPPRKYKIPPGVLRFGVNTIAIRVICNRSIGGFVEGKSYALEMGPHRVELSGPWKYKVGTQMDVLPQLTFFQYKPSGVYNAMIAPLSKYSFQGVLWYQGESNTHEPENYQILFEALIANWRETFKSPDLPFLFVQLPNFDTSRERSKPFNWALLREAQLKALRVSNTAMAVAIDVGEENDLHPQNKKAIAERLALCAQKLIFGESLVAQGPLFQRLEPKDGFVEVHFISVGGGLVARGGELRCFEVCGPEGIFYPAHAQIEGNVIRVWSDAVPSPRGVRYAWDDNPVGANLKNAEGFPASPFQVWL